MLRFELMVTFDKKILITFIYIKTPIYCNLICGQIYHWIHFSPWFHLWLKKNFAYMTLVDEYTDWTLPVGLVLSVPWWFIVIKKCGLGFNVTKYVRRTIKHDSLQTNQSPSPPDEKNVASLPVQNIYLKKQLTFFSID